MLSVAPSSAVGSDRPRAPTVCDPRVAETHPRGAARPSSIFGHRSRSRVSFQGTNDFGSRYLWRPVGRLRHWPHASQAVGRVPFICEPSFGGWRLTQMTTIRKNAPSDILQVAPENAQSTQVAPGVLSSVTSEPISPRHGNHPFPARDRPVPEYAGRHVAASQRPVGRTAGRAARSSRRRAHGRHLPSLRDETGLLALNPHPTGVRDSRSLGHVEI